MCAHLYVCVCVLAWSLYIFTHSFFKSFEYKLHTSCPFISHYFSNFLRIQTFSLTRIVTDFSRFNFEITFIWFSAHIPILSVDLIIYINVFFPSSVGSSQLFFSHICLAWFNLEHFHSFSLSSVTLTFLKCITSFFFVVEHSSFRICLMFPPA